MYYKYFFLFLHLFFIRFFLDSIFLFYLFIFDLFSIHSKYNIIIVSFLKKKILKKKLNKLKILSDNMKCDKRQ